MATTYFYSPFRGGWCKESPQGFVSSVTWEEVADMMLADYPPTRLTNATINADPLTVAAWMAHHGFSWASTGGGYSAYTRDDGHVNESIIRADADVAPSVWTDRVCLLTSETSDESGVPVFTDAENVPLWAVRDALDGCDCYALAGLRWANAHHADVHDAHCKRNQG